MQIFQMLLGKYPSFMNALLSATPQTRGYYRGGGTMQGRHRHATQVRATKQAQRRQAHYRRMRGR